MFLCRRNFTPLFRVVLIPMFILLLFARQASSQNTAFIPAGDDLPVLQNLVTQFDNNYVQETAELPLKYRKEVEEMYKMRHDNIKAKFDKKEIYTSSIATSYLQKIIQEIVIGNALLSNKTLHCYFSKSDIPNASYLGERMIIFNMGLFKRLDNESQAAFIICHELAHYYLQHSENSIRSYVTTMNSEKVQHELRSIKKSQYNKRTELEKLVKNLTFDSRQHTRDHESQADSMAVEFMRNTRFDVRECLSTLALLDLIDTDSLDTEACLQKTFDAPGYRFKKRWLARETGLLGGHAMLKEDTTLADSLKTHPDCQSRIRYIEPLVMKYESPHQQKYPVDNIRFDELKVLFEYEITEYAFVSKNYTRSLFYTLVLSGKNLQIHTW